MTTDVPDDLHELEYARHILEEVLGWPGEEQPGNDGRLSAIDGKGWA